MQDMTRDTATMTAQNECMPDTISFTQKMVTSETFMTLFREGMGLVEATAAYLDGDGRADSRGLERMAALAYASESMRLTTRLMQLTSWLLLQRAVNENEITRDDAEREHRRVTLGTQDRTTNPEVFTKLPEKLQDLVAHSLRLQTRIHRIDADLKRPVLLPQPENENPIAREIGRLAEAFRRA